MRPRILALPMLVLGVSISVEKTSRAEGERRFRIRLTHLSKKEKRNNNANMGNILVSNFHRILFVIRCSSIGSRICSEPEPSSGTSETFLASSTWAVSDLPCGGITAGREKGMMS